MATISSPEKPSATAPTPPPQRPNQFRRPSTFSEMLGIFQHVGVLKLLVGRDLSMRYKGSLLGRLWPLVHPLGQLIIYTFVFSIVLKVGFGPDRSTSSFALYFMTGLIPWAIFSEAISRSSTVILENPNLVSKVIFPLEVLPLVNVFSAVCTQFLAFSVLFASAALFHKVHLTVLLLPVVALPLILFSAGTSLFLASLGVFLRDTRHLVSLALQAGMYATPILYPAKSVPEQYNWVLWINPLASIVDNFRKILLEGTIPDLTQFGIYSGVCFLVFIGGFYFFVKTKRSFADVM
ncbi:MAG: ABC transporter permease [Candidatus Obscuribacterales bacterium]|nr:ABC transporter permease [Candidatus Obscuribacterales bacterium]